MRGRSTTRQFREVKQIRMSDVVIVEAARTAIGRLNGSLASVKASDLGAVVIRALVQQARISPMEVSDVLMGQVLTAAQGQNPARQAAVAAGLPATTTAMTVNQICGSGLRTIAMGKQAIQSGDASIIIAGGQESMSLAPHAVHLRSKTHMSDRDMIDTMITDGVWDAFNDYHMGMTYENMASACGITREVQDRLALQSHRRAAAAREAGYFAEEIVPVSVHDRGEETIVEVDEFIREDTSLADLAALPPVFTKGGSVTAGNVSGLNDGAAAVLLMSAEEAERRKLAPLARIVSWATAGVEPHVMGAAPIAASRKALTKAGWKASQVDLIEAHEAAAAQIAAVSDEMNWSPAKINVNGGAIALGHPLAASGARMMVTLLHEMRRRDVARGLVTLCIGGGMGIAMCVERS